MKRAADGHVEIWTTAPPADGRANEAVRRMVSDWLCAPISNVQIVAGSSSRTKTIEVAGVMVLPEG